MKGRWLLMGALVLGCATEQPQVVEQKDPLSSVPVKAFTPESYAAYYPQPFDCEAGAEQLQDRSHEDAWSVLKICISRGKFTEIGLLFKPIWLHDLQTRPDAMPVIAKVIAARGADVGANLQKLHDHRVPIFSLEAAVKQPELYKGRFIVFRAQIDKLSKVGDALVAQLDEVGLSGSTSQRQVGDTFTISGSSESDSFGKSKGSTTFSRSHTVYDNSLEATGQTVIGQLNNPDPFFEPGQEFVMLGRFEGVGKPLPGESQPTARVTVLTFERPASLVVEN